MEGLTLFHGSYKENLLLITLIILIVDVVLVVTLGVKSDGWSKVTEGDIIVIVVVLVFTVCILIADITHLVERVLFSRKMGAYIEEAEFTADFKCVICLDNSKDHIGKLKCGHTFHYECIYDFITREALNDAVPSCPLCRRTMERFDKWIWMLNWRHLMFRDHSDMKGLISTV
ncbi:uncharacterized protein LOC127703054 isoform X2 [Mytilus californianus]|uniref:uncharacterized protein LOC127703054 isoform X2 n=1 Tax=Mytilus californianus TaxID=6549 RepID=UPI0022481FEA|nr:uncharacterized protein LOC127703054 isoform X2 [Mytilus californianus]